jgi:hypothetical protein
MLLHRLALTLFVLGGGLALSSPAPAADDWDFVVAPYLLAPRIDGEAGAGRFLNGADIDVDTRDILKALDFGAMIHLEARHRSGFGGILDYSLMKLSGKTGGPLLPNTTIKGEIFQGVFEGYGTYRVDLDDHKIDLYGGIRWWDIDVDASRRGAPGPTQSVNGGDDWVDPVVGARWIAQWGPKWRTSLGADIGGFGLGSDFTASTQVLVFYDAWENVSFAAGYRALMVDYDNGKSGSSDYFAYDTVTHGPQIGVVFRF